MEWVIVAVVAILGTVAVSLVYYFIVGPTERTAGVTQEQQRQKTTAEALGIGATAVDKVVIGQLKKVDTRLAAQQDRDPVDVANDAIQKRLKKLYGKKP